jgi:hypothetical protein
VETKASKQALTGDTPDTELLVNMMWTVCCSRRTALMGASDVAGMIGTRLEMAKKKDRAFFICPRWNEIADTARIGARGVATPILHANASCCQRPMTDNDPLTAIGEGMVPARRCL